MSKYFSESEVKICYESRCSGLWLHRELAAAGISNIVVHAASIEVAANDRVKTDKRDFLKMAHQLAAGRLKWIRVPSVEQEQERLLTRTREQLMRAKRRAQIQTRMRLHQFGLSLLHIERMIRLKDLDALLEKMDGDLRFTISCLCAEWECLAVQVKEIDRKLLERSKQSPFDAIYRSVPGIGILIAQVLSSELGGLSQFPNERTLFSFTGLTPGEYSIGNNMHRGSISRQGSGWLRHMLVEASWKAIRKDGVLKEFFEPKAKKACKKRAIVAEARKLVGRIRTAIVFLTRSKNQVHTSQSLTWLQRLLS